MKAWAISCNTEKYSTIFGIINILIQWFKKIFCMLFPWPTWRSHCCTKSSNLQALSNTQGYSHSMNMIIVCTQNWILKWLTNTHEYYSIEYELNNWVWGYSLVMSGATPESAQDWLKTTFNFFCLLWKRVPFPLFVLSAHEVIAREKTRFWILFGKKGRSLRESDHSGPFICFYFN